MSALAGNSAKPTTTKAVVAKLALITICFSTGDDTVNLTIVPQGFDLGPSTSALFEIYLDNGNDSLTVETAEPINSGSSIRNSLITANGSVGGKTIDLPFNASNFRSEAKLTIEASNLRELFALEPEAEIDRLDVNIAGSNISYALNNTDSEASTVTDEIIQADEVTLDIADSTLPTSIRVDLANFNANILSVEAANSVFTEVVIDASNITDLPNTTILEVNGRDAVVKVEEQDETTISFLEGNLTGEFRTIDFSSIEGGTSITNDFIPPDSADELDVDELVFGDEADTVLFTSDSTVVTEVGEEFSQRQIGNDNLMSFELGGGDDRFHDRPGTKDSDIYPGAGNDFIYGAGGYDTVRYPRGSRIDYEITVIDERTVEVYYKPDNTTDTLIDVEEIDFDGADDFVFNPYWKGPDLVEGSSYTTFTLQVFAENDWNQPPFVFAPWTNLVPKGTTEVTLTREFLLSNVVDPEGNEAEMEISFFDVRATDDTLNPEADTTEENADSYQITIPGGLNDEEQAIIIDYMVFDEPSGSDQGNTLYIYPSEDLDYSLAIAPINLTTSPESEIITATTFDDVLALNDGDDIVEGLTGNDLLQGQNGNDSLDGGEGNDSLVGGAGDDTIVGALGEGSDEYDGGEGIDVLSYEATNISLNADLQVGIVQNGETEEDSFTNIEDFLGSQAADTILGSEASNSLSGLAGNDMIEGKAGSDVLEGRAGNDTLDGGSDRDLLLGGDGDDVYISKVNESAGDVIQDINGNDTLQLLTADNTEATISLTEPTSGTIGIGKQDNNLIIDINADGILDLELDLTIAGFFSRSDEENGFVEQVGNLSQEEILEFFPNDAFFVNDNPEPFVNDNPEPTTQTRGATVYRFFNPSAGVHFYTADEAERDFVVNNLSNYTFEGDSFVTVNPEQNSAEEVYRFFNATTGVHLYTTDENERDFITENLSNFAYENISFYAYETEAEGTVPVHRFYEPTLGVHFYTPNEAERIFVEENLVNYDYEGIAYYGFPINSSDI